MTRKEKRPQHSTPTHFVRAPTHQIINHQSMENNSITPIHITKSHLQNVCHSYPPVCFLRKRSSKRHNNLTRTHTYENFPLSTTNQQKIINTSVTKNTKRDGQYSNHTMENYQNVGFHVSKDNTELHLFPFLQADNLTFDLKISRSVLSLRRRLSRT